jgi:HD-GYP domain-containing protein (c-di-GMP phosphodiesterase class II)
MNGLNYIPVRKSQIKHYVRVPLFYQSAPDSFVLYKPQGEPIDESRLDQGRMPGLFIKQNDRLHAIKELHRGFNQQISDSIKAGEVVDVKSTLCNLVEESLAESRSGTLEALPGTVHALVTGYSRHPEIFKKFASISFKDYSTVIHSVNVMALTLGFCFHAKFSIKEAKEIGLSALMHDVGKAEVPKEILHSPRKLTDAEFEQLKLHPRIGGEIIAAKQGIRKSIAIGALQHHEKLDGSGYPDGAREISFAGQLLGIIDCFEALTNEERPYRQAMKPLEALKLIKDDVEQGKFNRKIYEKFCYSLI